jgi:hypothetical protein
VRLSFQALFLNLKAVSLLLLCFLVSCSGYRVINPANPFDSYNIKSVTIPMFVNHSNIAKASVPFTKEISKVLSSYSSLRVYQGEDTGRMDAILIGIVTTPKYRQDTFTTKTETTSEASAKLDASTGTRAKFFIPTSTSYKTSLRLILIKNPTLQETEMARSELVKYLQTNPMKIVFNHVIEMNTTFGREAGDTVSPDSSGTVNFTKNKGNFEKSLSDAAKSAAVEFKETVLDVF